MTDYEATVIEKKHSKEVIVSKERKNASDRYKGYEGYRIGNDVGIIIVWFFVFFVVIWLALYALKPSYIMKGKTKEVDSGKALLASALLALVFIIFIVVVKLLVQYFVC